MTSYSSKLKEFFTGTSPADDRPVSIAEFLHDSILASHQNQPGFRHPDNHLWFREQCLSVCKKRLSTGNVFLLEALQAETDDAICRKLLAVKSYLLRRGYLQSFKEYSDRALILRCAEGNLFDQWEGIFILGSFGGTEGVKYLRSRLKTAPDDILRHAIRRSIERIGENRERKRKERGF